MADDAVARARQRGRRGGTQFAHQPQAQFRIDLETVILPRLGHIFARRQPRHLEITIGALKAGQQAARFKRIDRFGLIGDLFQILPLEQ